MIITMGRSILLRVDARSSDSYLGRDDDYFFQEKYSGSNLFFRGNFSSFHLLKERQIQLSSKKKGKVPKTVNEI